jgi:hypothetical protein
VTLFISSGMNRSGRLEYAAELMRCLNVHSYGRVVQNRVIADDRWRPSKPDIIISLPAQGLRQHARAGVDADHAACFPNELRQRDGIVAGPAANLQDAAPLARRNLGERELLVVLHRLQRADRAEKVRGASVRRVEEGHVAIHDEVGRAPTLVDGGF